MRFPLFLALAMASLSLTASAQTYPKLKAKPVHREQEAKKAAPIKEAKVPENSAAQELRRAEQSSAKSASKKNQQNAPKAGPMKAQHEKANPPIHFSSAKGGGTDLNAKGGNAYKGRLRQKGGNYHH